MDTTTNLRIAERFSRLTPEQRRAVYRKIRADGLGIGQFPIVPRDVSEASRCAPSYAQARQWFLWQLDPQSTAYHIAGALVLEGELDVAALRSDSCRATSASKLPRSAATSNSPSSTRAPAMWYAVLCGSNCHKNHWRACAYDGAQREASDTSRGTIGNCPMPSPSARIFR